MYGTIKYKCDTGGKKGSDLFYIHQFNGLVSLSVILI